MNQVDLIMVSGRVIERLILTASGLICLIMGARLAGTVIADKSSFEGQLSSISVKIQRIGPGVSFAIIGLVLMYISSTMQISTSDQQRLLSTGNSNFPFEFTDAQIRALYQAEQALRGGGDPELSDRTQMVVQLQRLRNAVISSKYKYTDEQVLKALAGNAENEGVLTKDQVSHIRYLWGRSDEP